MQRRAAPRWRGPAWWGRATGAGRSLLDQGRRSRDARARADVGRLTPGELAHLRRDHVGAGVDRLADLARAGLHLRDDLVPAAVTGVLEQRLERDPRAGQLVGAV